jgi:hypothetical protein
MWKTHDRLREKRNDRAIRVFLCVSGRRYSGIGIAKTIRSSTEVVIAWLTKNSMNWNRSRDPRPQQFALIRE